MGYQVYQGKKVLITGHTGFKGAWLSLWLQYLGAQVYGLSLEEPGAPASYTALGIQSHLFEESISDINDFKTYLDFYKKIRPDIVFHLAAQPLVRRSYREPLETIHTNFVGTAHVLEAIRTTDPKTPCVVVTSDKCYENSETARPYRETDPMGGYDIYSMTKGAAELLVSSYRRSFGLIVASGRAGNVVGGGDYAEDRVVPDCVRAVRANEPIVLRNPQSTRPWQHVLEPVSGYLALGERLLGHQALEFCCGWNFGPQDQKVYTVQNVVEGLIQYWGQGRWVHQKSDKQPHEAHILNLSIEKAQKELGWQPRLTFEQTIQKTVEWYHRFEKSKKDAGSMREFSLNQIEDYLNCG